MDNRIHNFNAGPATLPLPVLEKAQEEFLSMPGLGMSVFEISHRSSVFDEILAGTQSNLRKLYGIPDNYRILFLQGGALLQFSMVPINFLRGAEKPSDYIVTGSWGEKSVKEAKREGEVNIAWDGKAESYTHTPSPSELKLSGDSAYIHFTSNETIEGIQFASEPESGKVPLICDMSSDFLSKLLPIERYGLIYAGAQKNAGPAGTTIVIIREDMLERVPENQHSMLDYRLLAEKNSALNTPPVFAIYMVKLVTDWLLDEIGGLKKMSKLNSGKAKLLYDVIDQNPEFYRGHACTDSRSKMNVIFRLPSEEQEAEFIKEAEQANLHGLKGHRSVGGIRASIYNAMTLEGVKILRDFMLDIASRQT